MRQKFIQVFLVLKNQLNGVDNLMAIENSLWYFHATLKPTNMVLMWALCGLRPLQHHCDVLKHKNTATPYLTLSNGFFLQILTFLIKILQFISTSSNPWKDLFHSRKLHLKEEFFFLFKQQIAHLLVIAYQRDVCLTNKATTLDAINLPLCTCDIPQSAHKSLKPVQSFPPKSSALWATQPPQPSV